MRLAQREARHRRRRRFAGRGIVGLGLIGVAGLMVFQNQPRNRSTIERRVIMEVAAPPVPAARVAITRADLTQAEKTSGPVESIQTDPTIADRLTLPAEPARWTSVDNHQLLQDLADAGEPAGFVWVNGKMNLIFRGALRGE